MNDKTKTIVSGTVSLFKAVPMFAFVRDLNMVSAYDCMQEGFFVVTKGGTLVEQIPKALYEIISEAYGTNIKAFNNTFHKSFGRVATMNTQQYFVEQLMHYYSTYGAESIGKKLIPYLPTEELKIPDFDIRTKRFVVITAIEDYELQSLVEDFVYNTVSPSEKQIYQILPLLQHYVEDNTIRIEKIKSFELQVAAYDISHTVPTTPLTALRYLVYKTTGSTFIVKNRVTITSIVSQLQHCTAEKRNCIFKILNMVPINVWAQIFFRYKPIFLAYKKGLPESATLINRIRRAADTEHRPLSDVCLQNVTKLISENRVPEVLDILNKASNRELIKVANAIGYRLSTYKNPLPQVFNIRTGKTYVLNDGYKTENDVYKRFYTILGNIIDLLAERLHETYNGKVFYIPEYICYAAPTTEKQFTGNIPWGTIITGPDAEAFTAGIQWYDKDYHRTDIDLHMNSSTAHFGWNGGFRDGHQVIYTGDLTAAPAPAGAAEAFWFQPKDKNEKFILSTHLYSGPEDTEFKFAITEEKPSENDLRNQSFTFRNPAFPPIPMQFSKSSSLTLGLFAGNDFYIYGGSLSHDKVPVGNYESYINGIYAQLNSKMMLSEFLIAVGAEVIRNTEGLSDEELKNIIDLSPEALTATTLLDIIDGKI